MKSYLLDPLLVKFKVVWHGNKFLKAKLRNPRGMYEFENFSDTRDY